MKYKDNDDNDKKGDSFWDRMIDDLIWGAPLGGGVGINLKTGNIIPYPSFDEDNHHDWDNDEFSFDDLADFADDEDNDDGDRTLSFSLTFDSNTTARTSVPVTARRSKSSTTTRSAMSTASAEPYATTSKRFPRAFRWKKCSIFLKACL